MQRESATELPDSAATDPARIAGEVAATVRKRVADGTYSASLLQRIAIPVRSVAAVRWRRAASLRLGEPLLRKGGARGSLVMSAKSMVRRLAGWYVQPLATQQTAFNLALLERLAAIEHRVEELGPLWSREPGMPPAEGGVTALTPLRARTLVEASKLAPEGAVLIGGPSASHLLDAVGALQRQIVVVSNVLEELGAADRAPYAVIVLAGVLPLLSAGDLLRCLPRAAARLLPHGVLLADAPQSQRPPTSSDPAMISTITAGRLRALAEAAGLHVTLADTWRELSPPWCMIRATREE